MTTRLFVAESADALLERLERADTKERNRIARVLLYSTHDRPTERAEQKWLFLGIVQRGIQLDLNDRLNAHAAAAHKCLELQDIEAISWLLPRLHQAVDQSRELPWRGSIRHNRIHVGYSLSYVLLLSSLFAEASDFDRAAEKVSDLTHAIRVEQLGPGFFRTSANLTKCLGLMAIRQARAGQLERSAALSETIRAALQLATEVKSLRNSFFPISRSFARTRLDRTGALSDIARSNEFKENIRAHRILAAVQDIADPQTTKADRHRAEAAGVRLAVSNAFPGEQDAQCQRFDTLFP
jgi:hypothetical protein